MFAVDKDPGDKLWDCILEKMYLARQRITQHKKLVPKSAHPNFAFGNFFYPQNVMRHWDRVS